MIQVDHMIQSGNFCAYVHISIQKKLYNFNLLESDKQKPDIPLQ